MFNNSFSYSDHKELISTVSNYLVEHIGKRCLAILLVGAAARNEYTRGPDGKLLSDIDIFIVLPQRNIVSAIIAGNKLKNLIRADDCINYFSNSASISIGFLFSIKRSWSLSTPLMWELRENSKVLYGLELVKLWPEIKSPCQIPQWEGIRLIANRMCELLGGISHNSYSLINRKYLSWHMHYACLKLILACSDAFLIQDKEYRCHYRERYDQHLQHSDRFTRDQNDLIEKAYRAKLNSDMNFYCEDIEILIIKSLELAIYSLSLVGISSPSKLADRVQIEQPTAPGRISDYAFFLQRLMNRDYIPRRRSISMVYEAAFQLASYIIHMPNLDLSSDALKSKCSHLSYRYKISPQVVSIISK